MVTVISKNLQMISTSCVTTFRSDFLFVRPICSFNVHSVILETLSRFIFAALRDKILRDKQCVILYFPMSQKRYHKLKKSRDLILNRHSSKANVDVYMECWNVRSVVGLTRKLILRLVSFRWCFCGGFSFKQLRRCLSLKISVALHRRTKISLPPTLRFFLEEWDKLL